MERTSDHYKSAWAGLGTEKPDEAKISIVQRHGLVNIHLVIENKTGHKHC